MVRLFFIICYLRNIFKPFLYSGQPPRGLSLCQKSLEDPVLRFLLGEAQGLQLQQLVPGDLADGGLVDQAGIHAVGGDLRDGGHHALVHDDGVAL